MKPAKYVCIVQGLFGHEIKSAESLDKFPKRIKDYIKKEEHKGQWVMFKADADGQIHRCYSNGHKMRS